MSAILVVEDEPSLAKNLVRGLKGAGFAVELCVDGAAALERPLKDRFDLVILDLNLPGRSGLDLLEAWRGRSSTPVLVLTARTELHDRLRCFELGAVDYVPKPFWMEELIARVVAHLRLSSEAPVVLRRVADVVVDLDAREARSPDGPLALAPVELNLLLYFVEHRGRALSRGQIAKAALSLDRDASDRTVDSHVARLRKKLGPTAASRIETVWGIGYRLRKGPEDDDVS